MTAESGMAWYVQPETGIADLGGGILPRVVRRNAGGIIDICQITRYNLFVIDICQKGTAMPRPKLCRRICGYQDYWSFAPEDTEPSETTLLTLDEFETIRLIDRQKLTQEECAAAMGVSRATITGIYESARFKVADAMVSGKRIRITGGSYRMDNDPAAAGIKERGKIL